MCALVVAIALCVLAAAQPSNAADKAAKDGVIAFRVTFKFSDEAEWSFDLQEECGRATGRGRQEITGTVKPTLSGDLEVRRVGRRIVPDPETGSNINDLGAYFESSGPATYTLDSEREESTNSGPNCPEPIICNECSSSPPAKSCGTRNGKVTIRPDIGFVKKTAYIRLEDQWNDPDPFANDSGNTYCPQSMAIWTWGSGFPAISNPDGDQVVKIDTNRLMGFNRLTDRQKASCGSIIRRRDGSRALTYARSRCGDGKTEPSWITKADYTRSTKTILLRNDEPPKRWEVNQTSRLTIEYKFSSLLIELSR